MRRRFKEGSQTNEDFKSRYKRFAKSFRSMNPRNFGATYNVKFLKRRD